MRPVRLSLDPRRTESVPIRLTQEEAQGVALAAQAKDMTINEYFCWLMDDYIDQHGLLDPSDAAAGGGS